MKFPLFISSRYILSNKDSRLLNLVSIITIIGITLGVATLIIALSVLNGFEKTLTQKSQILIHTLKFHLIKMSYQTMNFILEK